MDDRKAYDVERMVIYARNALPGSLFVTCPNNGKSGGQMLSGKSSIDNGTRGFLDASLEEPYLKSGEDQIVGRECATY